MPRLLHALPLVAVVGCDLATDRLEGHWLGTADCGAEGVQTMSLTLDEVAEAHDGPTRLGELVRDSLYEGFLTTTVYAVVAPVQADPGTAIVLSIQCRSLESDNPSLEGLSCVGAEPGDFPVYWTEDDTMELDLFEDGTCVVSAERI